MLRNLSLAAALGSMAFGSALYAEDPYLEENGLIVMEAENTDSSLGQWKKSTSVSGYTGSGFIEFDGNSYRSGSAKSPLKYTFTIQTGGVYKLVLRSATTRPESTPDDQGNDCYLKMEGDFTSGGNADLADLTKNQKYFTVLKKANQWQWGKQFDMNNSHTFREAEYNFKAGETYTLTVSGRSKSYSIDRITIYRKSDYSASAAQKTTHPESSRGEGGNTAPVVDAGSDFSVSHDVSTVSLDATVSDDGNPEGSSLSYTWTQESGPETATINSPSSEDTTVDLPAVGKYVFKLDVSDGALSRSDTVTVNRQPDLGDLVYAVNCGGNAFTAADGTPYEADNYYSSGDSYSKSTAIAGTEDDELFYSERYSEAPATVDYAFPVDNGTYAVTLMWSENTGSGRLMDVTAEGELVIDGLDVKDAAGSNKTAHEELIAVTVSDGTLNLSIGKDAGATEDYPNIMAIRINSSEGNGGGGEPVERVISIGNLDGYIWTIDPEADSVDDNGSTTTFDGLDAENDHELTPTPGGKG